VDELLEYVENVCEAVEEFEDLAACIKVVRRKVEELIERVNRVEDNQVLDRLSYFGDLYDLYSK
jgi:hypothetical protein